jgi:uncharacterized protein (DUF4415 family)
MSEEEIVWIRDIGGVWMQEHPDGSLTPLPQGLTDWAAIDAKSEEQLLAEALSDPDALPLTDEQLAQFERVESKQPISIRLDDEVLDYFKARGRGYQTRINAVLKSYVKAQTARRQRRA